MAKITCFHLNTPSVSLNSTRDFVNLLEAMLIPSRFSFSFLETDFDLINDLLDEKKNNDTVDCNGYDNDDEVDEEPDDDSVEDYDLAIVSSDAIAADGAGRNSQPTIRALLSRVHYSWPRSHSI